ncbi:hypothetical protein DLEV_183 [Diachasmimorpha longicaudata entomopoxvirus]|uniref:Uncharacterized protein n=1 Tax=Diachasmimorpha longicaudata entomopoxvirus TaxID=109981 RepID=A0A7R5WMS0_9POXV|nr:hypothetical protein QKK69_gp183 [Diachasmimorpha longicaudata entomopoxvirus]AKS26474.1 hypothetical protein DLEV_183 [Diachasmimorpha longicaudata entomopoxvirus]
MANLPESIYRIPITKSLAYCGYPVCVTGNLDGFYFQAYPIVGAISNLTNMADIKKFVKTHVSAKDLVTLKDLIANNLYAWKGKLAQSPSQELFLTSNGLKTLITQVNNENARDFHNRVRGFACMLEFELKQQRRQQRFQQQNTRQARLSWFKHLKNCIRPQNLERS